MRPWARWNFGDADVAPWAIFDPTPPEDLAASAATMKVAGEAIALWTELAKASGRAVDVLALAERFGVPLLSAPVEPAPPAEDPAADPATARQHASARRFLRQHLQVAA